MSKKKLPKGVERRGETSFRIRVFNGYGDDGKKRSISRSVNFPSGMTEYAMIKECEGRRALLKAEIKNGQIIGAKQVTVREFAERWMKEHVCVKLAQGSIDNNRGYLDREILPALGHVKLHELTPYMITQFLNGLRVEGKRKGGGNYPPPRYEAITMCYRQCWPKPCSGARLLILPSIALMLPNSIRPRLNSTMMSKPMNCAESVRTRAHQI